jgi:hypothetical protein
MTSSPAFESVRWLDALSFYVIGEHYMYEPVGDVEYLGGTAYGPTGEHVAILRPAGTSDYLIYTAHEWADVARLVPLAEYEQPQDD